jgi:AcrR family transcriptional regulator
VLARDGFGGTTLGRIAAEAAAEKRNVLYYCGTRERLMVTVVHNLGARIIEAARQTTPTPKTHERCSARS